MKRFLIFILCVFLFGVVGEVYASPTMLQDECVMMGPGKPKKKTNKATYGHSQGTYNPKPFYSRRKSPKSKNSKNMPSATKHIG